MLIAYIQYNSLIDVYDPNPLISNTQFSNYLKWAGQMKKITEELELHVKN